MTKEEKQQLSFAVLKADEIFKITCGCVADCKITDPTFAVLCDLLDFVRLNTKYLMFDLEATRRELAQTKSEMPKREGDQGKGKV